MDASYLNSLYWGPIGVAISFITFLLTYFFQPPPASLENKLNSRFPEDRKAVIDLLGDIHWINRYNLAIKELVKTLHEFFGKNWKLTSFLRCMTLAFIYPVLLSTTAWLFFGHTGIGQFDLFNKIEEFWVRIFLLLKLLCVFIITLFTFIDRFNIQKTLEESISSLNFAKIHLPRYIAVTLSMLIMFSLLYYLITVVLEIFVDLSAAIIIISIFLTFSVSGRISSVASESTKFEKYSTQHVSTFATLYSFATIGTSMVTLSVTYLYFFPSLQMLSILLLFYVILPMINGFFDFLSWGITRYFLGHIMQKKEGLKGSVQIIAAIIGDVLTSFLLKVLFVLFLPSAIQLINLLLNRSQTPEIDVLAMLADASNDPFGKGLLVTGMLFTMFLPTIIHLATGLSAIMSAWAPNIKKLREEIPYSPRKKKQKLLPVMLKERVHKAYAYKMLWAVPASAIISISLISLTILFQALLAPIGNLFLALATCGTKFDINSCLLLLG